MKAYLVSKYKSPMQAGEVAEPAVGDRDVLIHVHVCASIRTRFSSHLTRAAEGSSSINETCSTLNSPVPAK